MEGKSTLMNVRNPMKSELRSLIRQKRKCKSELQNGHIDYVVYDLANFPFRATQTSDLYF